MSAQMFKGLALKEWKAIAKMLGRLPEEVPPPEMVNVRVDIVAGGTRFYALATRPDIPVVRALRLDDDGTERFVDLLFVHESDRWFVVEVTKEFQANAKEVLAGNERCCDALPLNSLDVAERKNVARA